MMIWFLWLECVERGRQCAVNIIYEEHYAFDWVTSLYWDNHRINLFNGNKEPLVDGAIVVMDVSEGPKLYSVYVLARAFKYNLHIIALFNKMDTTVYMPNEKHDEASLRKICINAGATTVYMPNEKHDETWLRKICINAGATTGSKHE